MGGVFLLREEEFEKLPKREREFFRPAVISESIEVGYLTPIAYVFYPYGAKAVISESALREKVPKYFAEYLKPKREALSRRAGIDKNNWWKLTWHRTWQEKPRPKLVCTYFGDAGSFAYDDSGNYVVVQGHCLDPKGHRTATEKVFLAYLAFFTSSLCSSLLSAVSNHVSGGQWNLSAKFLSQMPLPDLMDPEFDTNLLASMAKTGKAISLGDRFELPELDELARLSLHV